MVGQVRAAIAALCAVACVGCFSPNLDKDLLCDDGFCPFGFRCESDGVCRRRDSVPTPDASTADRIPGAADSSIAGPWSDPVLIEVVDGWAADPDLSPDGLELYYRVGDEFSPTDIWRVTRSSPDEPWENPEPVFEIGSGGQEFDPRFDPTGRVLYYTVGTVSESILYRVERPAIGETWGPPDVVSDLESPGSVTFSFSVVGAADQAAFSSNRNSVNVELFLTDGDGDNWGAIRPISEINDGGFDGSCDFSFDGLDLYFDSDREGDRRVFVAHRNSTTEAFQEPVRIEELGDENAEDPSISVDGRTLIFSRRTSGDRRLYMSTR